MSYPPEVFKKILIIDIAVFILLAILAYFNSYFPIDLVITRRLQSIQLDWFDSLMRILTFFGDPQRSLTGVLVLSFLLYLLRMRDDAVVILLSSFGLISTTTIIKFSVHRVRPQPDLVQKLMPQLTSGSFPSYHVIAAIAVFGYLYLLVHKHIDDSLVRRGLEALFLLLIFLMGVSRVYLGAHWASDVLGSFLLGFAWLGLLAKYYEKIFS